MIEKSDMEVEVSATLGAEIAPVAAAEARAVAPLLVRSIDAVAKSRLLTVGPDALLAEVAALHPGAGGAYGTARKKIPARACISHRALCDYISRTANRKHAHTLSD